MQMASVDQSVTFLLYVGAPAMRKPTSLRSLSGFTLIELLVVISIIALLVAILLPTLAAAKHSAMRLKCLAQLRSLSIATSAYSGDAKGYGPPHVFETPGTLPATVMPRWDTGRVGGGGRLGFTGLDPYLGISIDAAASEKFYYQNKGCPDYQIASQTKDQAFTMNHWMLGLWQPGDYTTASSTRNNWTNLESAKVKPSKTMIAVESSTQGINGSPTDPTMSNTLYDVPRAGGGYNFRARHQSKGLNFLYIDGHGAFLAWNGTAFDDLPIIKVP